MHGAVLSRLLVPDGTTGILGGVGDHLRPFPGQERQDVTVGEASSTHAVNAGQAVLLMLSI